jgi:hypothetical protein
MQFGDSFAQQRKILGQLGAERSSIYRPRCASIAAGFVALAFWNRL